MNKTTFYLHSKQVSGKANVSLVRDFFANKLSQFFRFCSTLLLVKKSHFRHNKAVASLVPIAFACLLVSQALPIYSQTVIYTESFETDGEGTRYFSNTYVDCVSDFFFRTNTNPVAPPVCGATFFGSTLTNPQGNYFWASEDVRSSSPTPNSRPPGSIVTQNILIAGYSGLTFSLYLATSSNNNVRWEASDSINLQVSVNGTAYRTFGRFMGKGDAVVGGRLGIDGNLDGTYNASDPTTDCDVVNFTKYTFTIPWTGDSMRLKLDYDQLGGTEELAIDLLELAGTLSCIPPIAYGVTGGGAYCAGGSGVLVGLPNSETGVNYQLYFNGANTGTTVAGNSGFPITFGNQTTAGTYAIVGTRTVGGCSTSMIGNAAISINPAPSTPSFTSGASVLCLGGTSTYQASSSNATSLLYSILGGVGANIDANTGVVNNVTGNFTVRATASNTCGTVTHDFPVTISALATAAISVSGGIVANPAATFPTNKLVTGCQGDNVTLTANTTNAPSHVWRRNGIQVGSTSAPTLTVNSGWGDYELIAYDVNGCGQAADTVGINLKPTPIANSGLDRNICQGTTTTLGTTAQANTTYTWTPNDGYLSSFSVANPTVLATLPNNTTYNLQITKSYTVLSTNFSCVSVLDPVNITLKAQPASPTISASATEACQGSVISVVASNIIGSVRWYVDNVATTNTNPLNVTSTSGISKTYTAKNLGANGCYSVTSNALNLVIQNAPTPTISSSVGIDVNNVIKVCPGITNAILTATSTAGSPTYTWFNPPNVASIGTGNTLTLANLATTNKTYYVRATYIYGGLTCTKNSVSKSIRQDATATGCRLIQAGETGENMLSVYPNPTQHFFQAQIQVLRAGEGNLHFINHLGQTLWNEKRYFEEGTTEMQFSLEHLPTGIYFIRLEMEEGSQSVKVVKE